MNIRKNEAGYATQEHILESGFTVYDVVKVNDMGQAIYEMPQFTNGEIFINGGYWHYVIKDKNDNKLWEGWWNSNEEFDQTIKSLTHS